MTAVFHERGVNERSLEKFELGYTLNSWNAFSQKAIAAGYSEEILEKAGLLIRRDDGKPSGTAFATAEL